MEQQKPKVEWVQDKTFEREGIVVQVNKLPLRRPKFSFTINQRTRDGKRTSRFIQAGSEGQGVVRVKSISVLVAELLQEVEVYIGQQMQAAEDSFIERAQEYEQRDIERDRPKIRRGLSGGAGSGKTARNREKKRRRVAG